MVSFVRRKNFARGRVTELLQPSPARVTPPCVHYVQDNCGGCQWQHLQIEAQREAKSQLVVDAFARIARHTIPAPVVTGDALTLGYRRTISLTVRGEGRRRVGGYHAVGSPDVIVPVGRCLIAHPDLQEAWDAMRRELGRLPAPVGRGREADLRVTLRRLDAGEIALAVEGGEAWPAPDLEALAAAVPRCRGIWWQPIKRPSRLVWERETGSTREPNDALTVSASFVQVNASIAERLSAHVESVVRAERPGHVVDAYAGSGELAVSLSADGITVTAIEWDVRAATFASARLSAPSRMLHGSVEARLPEGLPADVVVLNPPRGGVDTAVTDVLSAAAIAGKAPRLLVYVSCDPATLARDVARLEGWRVDAITCFDMFPQTAHVESVCLLRPEAA